MEPSDVIIDEGGGDEEYKLQANLLKDLGNELLQGGKIQEAITVYTQAIDLDPDNHVFYSNRCAAYMKHDSKSKALHDAEKCIKLAPTWSKGYVRLGAAQHSLKRFDAAIDTYKKGDLANVRRKWIDMTDIVTLRCLICVLIFVMKPLQRLPSSHYS